MQYAAPCSVNHAMAKRINFSSATSAVSKRDMKRDYVILITVSIASEYGAAVIKDRD